MSSDYLDLLRNKSWDIPKYNKNIVREDKLTAGWAFHYVNDFDNLVWGRWDYWFRTLNKGSLLEEGIPQIVWEDKPHPTCWKMLNNCLDCMAEKGMDRRDACVKLVGWLLYSLDHRCEFNPLGNQKDLENILYQIMVIPMMQLWPYDYFGEILSTMGHGQKSNAFYPTPLSLVSLMSDVTFEEGKDHRRREVCDPCAGTGRTLMAASNHSMRLSGQDIDATVLDVLKLNFWLYAPWGVLPFKKEFFDVKEETSI